MREFLDDAHKHNEDGYGRAQRLMKQELPKRFYKQTGVAEVDGGFAVTLDGRPTKTPGRVNVVVPHPGLAAAMAQEWSGQGDRIDPLTMPLVRLVNSAIEGGETVAGKLRQELERYAANDLMLYRADTPRELVAEQEAIWDPVLVALARHFGVSFQPTVGIMHQDQPEETLRRLGASLADEALLPLSAMVSIAGITGSGLIAIALRQRLLDPDAAWAAAHVDEDYNIRLWGEDPEVTNRRNLRRTEFDAALKIMELL